MAGLIMTHAGWRFDCRDIISTESRAMTKYVSVAVTEHENTPLVMDFRPNNIPCPILLLFSNQNDATDFNHDIVLRNPVQFAGGITGNGVTTVRHPTQDELRQCTYCCLMSRA